MLNSAKIWFKDFTIMADEEKVWELLEKCLESHDWLFTESDDELVITNGLNQQEYLNRLYHHLCSIDEPRARTLWYNKVPKINDLN